MIRFIDMSSPLGSTAMLVQRLWAGPLLFLACFCGLTSPASAQQRIGPSFNCGSPAVASQPVAQVICSSDELAYLDLAYVVAHQALLHSLDEAGRRALAAESALFVQGNTERCGLPKTGLLAKPPAARDMACIADRYRQRRADLLQRVRGPAAAEAILTPEDTLEIQQRLQAKGFLPPSPTVDGVLGPASRNALSTWQRVTGVPETAGFASKAVLAQLAGETIPVTPAPRSAAVPPSSAPAAGSRDTEGGNAQEFDRALASEASMPNGARVTCQDLASLTNRLIGLDEPLFGKPLRDYSDDDFRALVAKRNECAQTLGRLQTSERPAPSFEIAYIRQLYEWRFTKLEEEKRTADAAAQKRREIAELEEDKRLNPTKLPTCEDAQVVRLLAELISKRANEKVAIVDVQPRPREASLMPDVYVPADGLYRREGMEWRQCLSFVPYEFQGAPRKLPVLYRITWQARAKGEFVIVLE